MGEHNLLWGGGRKGEKGQMTKPRKNYFNINKYKIKKYLKIK
jgi:hypothetical protein